MVIQHNLTAINANRQLDITIGTLTKSSQKLSSGYRINRAADDSSGLAISEKMRRLIRGLRQASDNAQDGISFIQVADGALSEADDILQRMNELSVKAANGTFDSNDREYVNTEFNQLKEALDQIGTNTKFNELEVFPPNGSSTTEATPAQLELTNIIATEYIPTAVSQIVSKLSGSLGNKLTSLASANPEAYAMDLNIGYIDGPSGTLAYMQSSFYGYDNMADKFAEGMLLMKVDSADFSSSSLSDADKQILQSTIAHELMHGVMDILLPEGMCRNDSADQNRGNFPKWFVEGAAQLVGGGYTTGWNDTLMRIADLSVPDSVKLSNVSNYLKNYTVDERPYGHGYLACAYLCQLASGSPLGSVTQNSLITGANKIFNALMTNENNYRNGGTGNVSSFNDVINSTISNLTLTDVINNINSGETNASKFVLALTEASKSSSTSGFNGSGSIVAPSLNSPYVFGSTVTSQQAMYVKNADTSAYSDAANATAFKLQVGADSNDSNVIEIKRFAMSQSALNLSNSTVLTQDEAVASISTVKNALVIVNTIRTYYGAMQNRLEHTIKNLDNAVENTTSAESIIRDTDMASEMVNYSKANILAQAGQSVLANANHTSQDILKLI